MIVFISVVILFGVAAAGLVAYFMFWPPVWHVSGPGNLAALYRGKRITVFPGDSGSLWKFCIADLEGAVAPLYSEWYADMEAAKGAAITIVATGLLSSDAHHEERREALRESAYDILARSIRKRNEVTRAVGRLENVRFPTEDQISRVSEEVDETFRSAQHAHHALIDCDAGDDIIRRAKMVPFEIMCLRDRLDVVRATRAH